MTKLAVYYTSLIGIANPWCASVVKDIGSGNCTVHNTLLFDHPQKSVIWAPWRYHPVPFWSPYNRNAAKVVPAAIKFLASPTLLGVCPVVIAALQG